MNTGVTAHDITWLRTDHLPSPGRAPAPRRSRARPRPYPCPSAIRRLPMLAPLTSSRPAITVQAGEPPPPVCVWEHVARVGAAS